MGLMALWPIPDEPPSHYLLNNKILLYTKSKAYGDHNMNVTQNLKFLMTRVENIVGKSKNAGYQHFHIYLQCFQSFLF